MEKKKREPKLFSRYKKISLIFLLSLFAGGLFVYGLSWSMSATRYPAEWGVSFSKQYAESLGLDWQKTYQAILDELKPRHMRISADWDAVESTQGKYQFDDTDWQMIQAAKRNVKVTLVVGQKTPRWPECHFPDWLPGNKGEVKAAYLNFVSQVVTRYQSHPALDTWQVENEPFISIDFGECDQYDDSLVFEELDKIKKIDDHHPALITDSGELNLWLKSSRIGDRFGTTIYRMVRLPTSHRFSYAWLPPGFYKLRARLLGISYEHFYVSELQAEPWFHDGNPTTASVEEMEETMNPEMLQENINYAERVGASRIYLWGAEWWYYMKEARGEGEYWETVKNTIHVDE